MKHALSTWYFPSEEIERILSDIRKIFVTGASLSMGQNVKQFENELRDFTGAQFAIGTNSCSSALEIALNSIGMEHGDEVIVPAETFIATGAAVLRTGGRPVFAEIDPETFCLSKASVEEKLGPRTKAVILVTMAGAIPPDVFHLKELCRAHDVVLIEDAAHSLGAEIDNVKSGCIGDLTCFSFYHSKVITTGEGGAVTTSNRRYYETAQSLRNRGIDIHSAEERYIRVSSNFRMPEISAILGLSQLRCIKDFISIRRKIARIYTRYIDSSNFAQVLRYPNFPDNVKHVYWRYIVTLPRGFNRSTLKKRMAADKIQIDWAYNPPLHLQPVFVNMFGNKEGMLPVSEDVLGRIICLPIHHRMSDRDGEYVISRLLHHMEREGWNDIQKREL